jgi:hypothetical protein
MKRIISRIQCSRCVCETEGEVNRPPGIPVTFFKKLMIVDRRQFGSKILANW